MTWLCPKADSVVAVFLDGDADCQASPDLTGHLAGCPDCQHALDHSRRLDAALASSSGAPWDAQLAERLLSQTVAPAASAASAAPGPRKRPLALALAATALVMAGAGIGHCLDPDHPQPGPDLGPGGPTGFFALPELPPYPGRTNAPPAPGMLATRPQARLPEHLVWARVLRDHRQGLDLVMLPALALARLPDWRGLREEAGLAQDRMRVQAARQLLLSNRAASWGQLLSYVAHGRQDPVLQRVLVQTARDPRFLAFVRGELCRDPDGPALAAAARLAAPSLDRLLRGACRGRPVRCGRLAAALAEVKRRAGRVDLLLDLWQGLADRGLVAHDRRLAAQWFRGLPAATTAELAVVASTTVRASRRRHAILALGARGDAAALPDLLDLVAGPRHDDAVLAAQALGQLPLAEVEAQVLASLQSSRRPNLLLAALASMCSPRVQAHVQALDLTAHERRFLAAGRFDPTQFTLAARLLRDHRRLTD